MTIITVENLSKKYLIGHQKGLRYQTLRDTMASTARGLWQRICHPLSPNREKIELEELWALKDMSFEVQQGERIGIIGRNGAGKTTLFKILSRITHPTTGRIHIKGRIASLLEVGTGFHPELTGRENIYLNGAILGMARQEIKKKFDEIVAFAEIEKFLDTPVKRYSSGMYVRLAFAVAAHLEAELILVDEVLAVGDYQFQKKCLGKMRETTLGGRTVLFISHNMSAIRQLCPTCLWIHHGNIKKAGPSFAVINAYLEETARTGEAAEAIFAEDPSKEFKVRSVQLRNVQGEITQKFDCDHPIIIDLVCQIHRKIPGLYGYLEILRKDGTTVLTSYSLDVVPNPLDDLPISLSRVRITLPPRTLAPGDYDVYFNFTSHFSLRDFNVDSPGIVCSFQLDDFTSSAGNQRTGFFSTLLAWNVSPV
jgi:lipopolysaccharide transport system ATP-binding protein